MNSIKVSLDKEAFTIKPEGGKIGQISDRIARTIVCISPDKIKSFAEAVGQLGHTFCPATFRNGQRNKDSFEQMQLFVLDFDSNKPENIISWEQVKERAETYNLPILFAYESFSSVDRSRFRVAFLNDISITDIQAAEVVIKALRTIFPESDDSCKDASHMFFGGKNLFYFDDNMPEINIESLIMNMGLFLKDTYGANNYGREITKFAQSTGLALDSNTTLAVSVYYNEEDFINENFSPFDITYINRNGDFSSKAYKLSFDNNVGIIAKNDWDTDDKHKQCRTPLDIVEQKCRLLHEFMNGDLWLYHEHLVGLAMNLIHIDGGRKCFIDTLEKYNRKYRSYPKKLREFGSHYLSYFVKKDYAPMRCENYCPYADTCHHGLNIITTTKTNRHEIIKLANSEDKYISVEEIQANLAKALDTAMSSPDSCKHIIKSPLGSGKTQKALEYIRDSDELCAIAFPPNILKNEKCEDAYGMGIRAMATPSLYEINMPDDIWEEIQKLYKSGSFVEVKPYIQEVVKEHDILSLKQYLEDEQTVKSWDGHLFTTHNKMLSSPKLFQNYKKLFDEDVINTFLTSQVVVKVSELEYMLDTFFLPEKVEDKIRQAIECSKTKRLFTFPRVDYSAGKNGQDEDITFDISSFCRAEKFCSPQNFSDKTESDDEENALNDCICYFKPVNFTNTKYTVMSATANEEIDKYFFGADNIRFYDCGTVKYRGSLYQYNVPMSRNFVKNNPNIYDRSKDKVKDTIKTEHPELNMNEITKKVDKMALITFKNKIPGARHWFGNVAGTNDYEGQDIIVAGTPHVPDFIYKFFAYTLGLHFDVNAQVRYQEVEHNGFKFWFTTYDDKVLRAIQFWIIESELEQAIGRARLIWHDCTVHLFSDFPLKQAQLMDFYY